MRAASRGLPRFLTGDRRTDAVLLPVIGIGQAGALGLAAFATRDAFAGLHEGVSPGPGTLVAMALAAGLAGGLVLLARRRGEALGQSYAQALRHALYEHLSGMDRAAVDARRRGSLSLRFVGDLSAARLWFGRGLPRLISAGVVFPGAALALWLLDPRLALAACGPVAVSLVVMLALATGLRARQEALRGRRSALSIAMMERIPLAPDLDLMARSDRELEGLDAEGAALAGQAVGRVTRVGLIRLVPEIGAGLAGAIVLGIAASSGMAPGLAAAGLSVLAILMVPLRDCAGCWDAWCAWSVARERALDLLGQPSTRRVVVPRGAPVAVGLEGLRLGGRVLRAAFPAGGVTLVTGPAGSGKSRLGTLIAGLDRPGPGEVLYDGASGPLPRIVHVGDRPGIVQGSLRRALSMGIAPRPSSRKVERVARDFGLGAMLDRMGGIRARVGEGARTLSQGEGLRVELARAALARPDLIVIDSARLIADPERPALLARLRKAAGATLILMAADGEGLTADHTIDLTP